MAQWEKNPPAIQETQEMWVRSWVRKIPWRRLKAEELMLLNWGVGEDSWESLGLQEDQTVNPKGNQSWIFIGRTDAETEALWPPDVKNWLTGKDPDAGKDWRQVEKGTTEDEMVGWHHGLNGRESEWTPGDGDEQGGLVCCDSWGRKESDTTEWLNWTECLWMITWSCTDPFYWQYKSELFPVLDYYKCDTTTYHDNFFGCKYVLLTFHV